METSLAEAIPALEGMQVLLDALAPLAGWGETAVAGLVLVFARVGATVSLLPGFGEQTVPLRLKLAAALCMTMIVWPLVLPRMPALPEGLIDFTLMLLAETVAGLALGIALRLMIMVLQLAGSIAAQSTAISQIGAVGVMPDPMPAIGNILVLAGIALALAGGLHIKAAAMLAASYDLLPLGRFPGAGDLAAWGTAQVAHAFALAVTLAGPFVLLSFLYNLALGAINRAMPQLMVAFVGAPAITGGALIVLLLAAPLLLAVWVDALDLVLAGPLEVPR